MNEKTVTIEYLYLDLQSCDRCIGTDAVLEEAIAELTPTLERAGFSIDYRKIEMKTAAIAEKHQFLSSPTIRVNGQDICATVAENSCGCCSDISGSAVDCRVFVHEGNSYEVPPKEMLVKGILEAVFSAPKMTNNNKYTLPENLQRFFIGKTKKSACCCSGNCCNQ